MRARQSTHGLVGSLGVLLLVAGCQASSDAPGGASGGNGSGGTSSGLAGSAALPPGTQPAALLPARIRRLTNAEYGATAVDLFGAAAASVGQDFVPDSRQGGFTVNEAQRVDPVLARQLSEAAGVLAADLRTHIDERAPCGDKVAGALGCATSFIRAFGERAYRRPLAEDEVAQLMTVFGSAFEGGSYEEGIELVVRAMLQSAAFLYLTEIGAAPAATIQLTPLELASAISYLIQGRPPTADLLAQAAAGQLASPEGRGAAVAGLLGVDARARVVRVIREWLGTDRLAHTAKDTIVYREFGLVKAAMERESTEFLQEIVQNEGASLAKLLSADFTVANAPLAALYGGSAASPDVFERIATPNRRGILNQGAFLSVYAHASETAPVLRGVAVMRRVACIPLLDPVDLSLAVVPPAPDSTKSTRERFDIHAKDKVCGVCHRQIDNFGFAFEAFDGMGKIRPSDNGRPIDTNVAISGTDFDGSYADSNQLAIALSQSPQVRECFARQVYRGLSGTSVAELQPSEDEFITYWRGAQPSADVSIIDTLTAVVTNPAFAYRRAE